VKSAHDNKQVKRNINYDKGLTDAVNSMLIIVAYVLSCFGYKKAKIQQIVNKIQDVADSINKGYITHQDLEDELWNDYGILMQKRKGVYDDR
jgi:hypothetical protein